MPPSQFFHRPLWRRGTAKREIKSTLLQKKQILLSSAATLWNKEKMMFLLTTAVLFDISSSHLWLFYFIFIFWFFGGGVRSDSSPIPRTRSSSVFLNQGKRLKPDKVLGGRRGDEIKHEIMIDDKRRYDDSAELWGRLKNAPWRRSRCDVFNLFSQF